jgi:hypothetical protein
MLDLCGLSDRLVVMSERGREFLEDIYKVPAEKVDLIHHGIPDVPFVDPNFYKDKFGVEGRLVLLTFGLLSPSKGIEYMIRAMPEVVKRHPNAVYIVLGATHPHLRRDQGEGYRLSLQQLVRSLNLEEHVLFHNRFVALDELVEFIGSADLYVTPYLNEAQIVSGTLAYTVGAGKAVVSTPYWYAEEMLAGDRGLLAPFKSPEALAERVTHMLDHEAERHAMRKRCYQLGRHMVWREVANRYMDAFERAREEGFKRASRMTTVQAWAKRSRELPHVKLNHLRRLTDHTGLLQHATFSVPNYAEGYCADDNARALALCVMLQDLGDRPRAEAAALQHRYLAFLLHAFNPDRGRFRNFMAYDRRWLEDAGSDDSHGRALWALGTAAGRCRDESLRGLAVRLFEDALPAMRDIGSPRAWAFSLLGIMEFMRRYYGHRPAQEARVELAGRLMTLYNRYRRKDWLWFEPIVAYANGKLPHALILCGQWLDDGEMVDAGVEALRWLMDLQTLDGRFVPIGSEGQYPQGGERARFDQQPIEAHAAVSACLQAHRTTQDDAWLQRAQLAFDWFLGRNDLQAPLYDPSTGGCFDGLTPDRANQNQGAESTLAFLLSLTEMRLAESLIDPAELPGKPGASGAAAAS